MKRIKKVRNELFKVKLNNKLFLWGKRGLYDTFGTIIRRRKNFIDKKKPIYYNIILFVFEMFSQGHLRYWKIVLRNKIQDTLILVEYKQFKSYLNLGTEIMKMIKTNFFSKDLQVITIF